MPRTRSVLIWNVVPLGSAERRVDAGSPRAVQQGTAAREPDPGLAVPFLFIAPPASLQAGVDNGRTTVAHSSRQVLTTERFL